MTRSKANLENSVDKRERGDFVRFLHCQLLMESQHILEEALPADFKVASKDGLWDRYREFACIRTPARFEKWVPFHTCLQLHERFILEEIHSAQCRNWTERRRFIAMFLFRAHCRVELFREAQMPILRSEAFWKDMYSPWEPGGEMEESMLHYRRRTGLALQTAAFRCIPRRILQDNDRNLVRNICQRSVALIDCAIDVWNLVRGALQRLRMPRSRGATGDLSGAALYTGIEAAMRKVPRIGDTWVKMLMVCIDHRYPELNLLQETCEVGIGAFPALKRIVPIQDTNAREGLTALTASLNNLCDSDGNAFWEVADKVEKIARGMFSHSGLICEHLHVAHRGLSAATVQVQLCEWRQFLDFMARKANADNKPALSSGKRATRPATSRKRKASTSSAIRKVSRRKVAAS